MADYSLEIHHLDVRGGDATAIIVKEHNKDHDMETGEAPETETELYRVLIDAGAEGKGSGALKFYLKNYLPGPFDLVVATHYHQDHIQGFSQAKITFNKFIDNGSYTDADGTEQRPKNDIGKGARTKIFDRYVTRTQTNMVANPNGPLEKPKRVPIPFIKKKSKPEDNGPVEIELGTGTGIKLIIYSANGVLADGTDVLGPLAKAKQKAISPNDVSIAMVIEWGNFRYFTAGDLSGDKDGNSYYDIETPLVNYLVSPGPKVGPLFNKPITVFKASHHGSEFSNQSHLLNALKPDSVIVCCNLQKQVPSPIFLERLSKYLKADEDRRVIFTNTMKVFKQDDRYTGLAKITKSIADGNVSFETADDEFATNLGMKCAVIRRRVQNGKVIMPTKPAKRCWRTYDEGLGYEILLMRRSANDKDQISQTVRFTSYTLSCTWDDRRCNLDTIVTQFTKQAGLMLGWLANDEKIKKTKGQDYISEHYPALMRVITESGGNKTKEALVNKMKEMFLASFRLVDFRTSKDWMRTAAADNKLTSDEKKTIFNLLWNNYHQDTWNGAVPRSGAFYDRDKSWNAPAPRGFAPEPDAVEPSKRKAETQPENRKKQKTGK